MIPELIPLKEAAEKLQMSTRHLRRIMAEGNIDYKKRPGTHGRVFFTETQINNYIKTL